MVQHKLLDLFFNRESKGEINMTYPRIEIYLDKIKHNTSKLVSICADSNIKVAGVTKVFCGDPTIAKALLDGGVSILADSRIENLKELKDINLPKLLLRLPMLSQAVEVVRYADISLNSEIETIKELSKKAMESGKIHDIILMIDLGDLREGIYEEKQIIDTVTEILTLPGVRLVGLGTNLTCYGGIIPRSDNLNKLVEYSQIIESKFNIKLEIISGGNSSSLHLLESKEMPPKINQLRLGESLVLGRETAFGSLINETYDDCFKLVAEIIEIKDKPSIPIGEIGMDAFGNKPTFVDMGTRRRAICAVGKQDVDPGDIIPEDSNIKILGSSSDHLILDITEVEHKYIIGDKVIFKLTYGGILRLMTSKYISKVYK